MLVCKLFALNLSLFANNVSLTVFLFALNLSSESLCLRARAPLFASRYSYLSAQSETGETTVLGESAIEPNRDDGETTSDPQKETITGTDGAARKSRPVPGNEFC